MYPRRFRGATLGGVRAEGAAFRGARESRPHASTAPKAAMRGTLARASPPTPRRAETCARGRPRTREVRASGVGDRTETATHVRTIRELSPKRGHADSARSDSKICSMYRYASAVSGRNRMCFAAKSPRFHFPLSYRGRSSSKGVADIMKESSSTRVIPLGSPLFDNSRANSGNFS